MCFEDGVQALLMGFLPHLATAPREVRKSCQHLLPPRTTLCRSRQQSEVPSDALLLGTQEELRSPLLH